MAFPSADYGGATYEYGKQANLYTEAEPAAYRFFRPSGAPGAWPSKTKTLMPQEQRGHALDVDYSDKGTLIEQVQTGAISFDADVRTGNAAGVQPPIMDWLESGGWNVDAGSAATTIATYTDEGEFTLTADVFGADAEGVLILVELDSGVYYPALVYDYTASTKTCKLAMKLPSASSVGKAVEIMRCATPRTGAITASDLLSFRKINRATYNSNQIGITCIGCALESIGTLTLEPAGFLKFPLTFTVADVVLSDESLSAETLRGATSLTPIQGMEIGLANASASAINNTQYIIHKAEITIKDGAVHEPAEGNTTSVLNSCQGYHSERPGGDDGRVELVLEATFSKSEIDDYTNQQMMYFHAVRTTSATTAPAWSIHMPRIEPVDYAILDEGSQWVKMSLTYKATSANYAATHGDNTESGDRDIFIGISDYS